MKIFFCSCFPCMNKELSQESHSNTITYKINMLDTVDNLVHRLSESTGRTLTKQDIIDGLNDENSFKFVHNSNMPDHGLIPGKLIKIKLPTS